MKRLKLSFISITGLVGAITGALVAPYVLQLLFSYVRQFTVPPPLRTQNDIYTRSTHPLSVAPVALLGMILGFVLGTILIRIHQRITGGWERMHTGERVTLFLGAFAGIIASLPFLLIFAGLGNIYGPLSMLAMVVGFSAFSIYALRSMGDVLPWQRAGENPRRTGIKILDTNVIIDGRIHDVARTGFLEGKFYIPQFVLEELQHIADSGDALKRQRGRRGLEVLRYLQADFSLEVGAKDKLAPPAGDDVDARLVRLARAMGADLVTNDVNLSRVATIQNVNVLNINDLAMALKPNVLPRENLTVTVVKEGNQPGQGVGYLDDGTMVVIEGGRRLINQTVPVLVTQVIQTERGKMIFAEADGAEEPEREYEPQARRRHRYEPQ